MQRTGRNDGQDFIVLLVMVVAIWGAILIAMLATGYDSQSANDKAYDALMATPEPEWACVKDDEYVISSDCPSP